MISKISAHDDYDLKTTYGLARYMRDMEKGGEKTFRDMYTFTELDLEEYQKGKEEEKHRSDDDDFLVKYMGVRRPNGSVGAIAYDEATSDNKDQHILNSSMIEEAEMAGMCDAPGESQSILAPAAAGGIDLTKDQIDLLDGKYDLTDKTDQAERLDRLTEAYDKVLRQDKLLASDLAQLTAYSGQIASITGRDQSHPAQP